MRDGCFDMAIFYWLFIAVVLAIANIPSCNKRLTFETPPGSSHSGMAGSVDVLLEHAVKAVGWPVVAVVKTWSTIVDNSWEFDTWHRENVDRANKKQGVEHASD